VRSSLGACPVPSIARVRPGDLVSLRVRDAAGPRDVVGELVAATPTTVSVRRRDGSLEQIAVDDVEAGRVVPPGPERTISVTELQRIAATGWRAPTIEPLGEWLLRAADDITGRANSALPLGDPGMPLGEAIHAVRRWYADRGLPPRFQTPIGHIDPDLEARLDAASWAAGPPVHLMTAALGPVLRRRGADESQVELDEAPDDAWLELWRASAEKEAARRLATNHERAIFASVRDAGEVVATARASVDGRWAGLFCVAVAPSSRRHGLGRAVSIAALRWAVSVGARFSYLQTEAGNEPAISLYSGLGYRAHHDYRYRTATIPS